MKAFCSGISTTEDVRICRLTYGVHRTNLSPVCGPVLSPIPHKDLGNLPAATLPNQDSETHSARARPCGWEGERIRSGNRGS